MLVIFVSQSWANKGTRSAQRVYISTNDGRLGALRELLYGIGGVKALGYETVFKERINQFRDKQAGALRKVRICILRLLLDVVAGGWDTLMHSILSISFFPSVTSQLLTKL